MDRNLISKILVIIAVICAGVAWFAAAGWIDDFNVLAWGFAGIAAYFASRLVVEL